MANRADNIQEIVKRLRLLRVEIKQEVAKLEIKARQYDMLHDLTPQQEDKVDAICSRQDTLEEQLDAISAALEALSYFNALK